MTEHKKTGISVSGSGEVSAKPDTMTIELGVSVRRNTVQEATTEASQAAANLIAALTDSGVVENSITTTRYSINPEYDHRNDSRILLGYRVANSVKATIADLDRSGEIIDGATAAAGDSVTVNGVSFGVEDDKELVVAAREAAWGDARSKAEQLAGLAGRQLGPVTSITENLGRPPAPMHMARLQAADASTPIQAGSASVSVSLEVEFAFQD
jgi:uncharacterized protein